MSFVQCNLLHLSPLHSAIYTSGALSKNKIFNLIYLVKYLSAMGAIKRFGCAMISQSYKYNQNAEESSFFSLSRGKTTLQLSLLQGKLSSTRAFSAVQFSPSEAFALTISLLDHIFTIQGTKPSTQATFNILKLSSPRALCTHKLSSSDNFSLLPFVISMIKPNILYSFSCIQIQSKLCTI